MKLLTFLFCISSLTLQADPIALFNGKDLTGWTIDVPEKSEEPTFFVRDGKFVTSGKPLGHIYTEKEYENYTLTIDYRFSKKPGNCGVMLHSTTPGFINKIFPRSVEVQMKSSSAGMFIPIGENILGIDGKDTPEMIGKTKIRFIPRLSETAENTPGEWNTMVIHSQGDVLVVIINGTLVNVASKSSVTKGKIALQSEGSEVEFRKIELTPIP